MTRSFLAFLNRPCKQGRTPSFTTKWAYPVDKLASYPLYKNSAMYMVEVQIFNDIAMTQLLGEHKQKVLFNLVPEVSRAFGIEALYA